MSARTAPGLDDRLTVSPDVVFREIEGEAVLLELESGTYFGLNAVGTRIWGLIQERDSLRAVLDTMAAEYDAPPAVIERDLLRVSAELCAKGLVRVESARG